MDTYRATNTTNGKFYIGSSLDFEVRKAGHLSSKHNYPFQNALRKTPGAFEWEVWTDDSSEPILEQALLDMWYGKECCYNLSPFASRPPVQTQEKLVENGRKGGLACLKKSSGMFAPGNLGLGGKRSAELGVGCHDSENASKGGKTSGEAAVVNQTGIHSPEYKQSCKKDKSAGGKARALQAKNELWGDPEHPELGAHHFNTLKKLQRERGYPSGKQNKVKVDLC